MRGGHGHLWPPQALETWYAGHHFRSRREARWAVFFNTLGIDWEYEPQGFNINGTPYLPDFLLKPKRVKPIDSGILYDPTPYWFEVKGQRPTEEEKQKAAGLAAITKMACFIYFEQPRLTTDITAFHFLAGSGEDLEGPWLWSDCMCQPEPAMSLYGRHWCVLMNKPNMPINSTPLQQAFHAARSARFGT